MRHRFPRFFALPAAVAGFAALCAVVSPVGVRADHLGRTAAVLPDNIRLYSGDGSFAVEWTNRWGHTGTDRSNGYSFFDDYVARVHYQPCNIPSPPAISNERCWVNEAGQRRWKGGWDNEWSERIGACLGNCDPRYGGTSRWLLQAEPSHYITQTGFTKGRRVRIQISNDGKGTNWTEVKDGGVGEIVIGVPPPVRNVTTRHDGERVHITWDAGVFPAWLLAETHGHGRRFTIPPTRGYAFRWLRNGVRAGFASSPIAAEDTPTDQGYLEVDANARSASFPALRGRNYTVQVTSRNQHGVAKWSADMLAEAVPLWQMEIQTGVAGGALTTRKVLPDFAARTNGQIFEFGPIPHAHNRARVSINNRLVPGAHKALLIGQNSVCARPDALLCTWELQLNATALWQLEIGNSGSDKSLYILRDGGRLDGNGRTVAPSGLTLTPSDYLAEDGDYKPQVTLKWRADKFAESYALTCQNITDPANESQICLSADFFAINPPLAADGLLSYDLRRPGFDFGGAARVNVAANLPGVGGNLLTGHFASATATFRARNADPALAELQLVHAGGYALMPDFHPERTEYTLRVDNALRFTTESGDAAPGVLRILPRANFYAAKIAVSGIAQANANVGASEIALSVTAESGGTETYTIGVTRYPRVDAVDFAAGGDAAEMTFAPSRNFSAHAANRAYTYDLPFAVFDGTFAVRADAKVTLTLRDSGGAEIAGAREDLAGTQKRTNFPVTIPIGGEVFTLRALHTERADNSFHADYAFHLLRPLAPSNDSALHTLAVTDAASGGEIALSPAFDAGVLTYDVTAESAELTLATTAQKRARVTVNQRETDGETALQIARGATPVEIAVTAENGGVTRYLLRIWYPPPGGAAQIAGVSAIAFSGGRLSPAFAPARYTYALTETARGLTATTFTATTAPGVTVEARTTRGGDYAVAADAGVELPLLPGARNYISVRTSAVGAEAAVYSVYADIAAPPSTHAALRSVLARDREHALVFAQSGAGATPGAGFAAAHAEYAVEILHTARSVFMTATAHEFATFRIAGETTAAGVEREVTLQSGDTVVAIVVTAEDGTTQQTYTFTYRRGDSPTEPLPPQDLQAESPANFQLRAAWNPPAANGGAAVTTYFARWRERDPGAAWANPAGARGEAVTPDSAASAVTYVLGGSFSPGVTYEVQVAAANTVGISEWAAARGAANGTVLPPPQFRVLSGDEKVSVNWTAPGGVRISEYRIRHAEVTPASRHNWADMRGAQVAHESGVNTYAHDIAGLQNATVYAVQIAAVNSNGRGPWSASESATPSARVLGMPQNLQGASGNHRITLQWQPPAAGTPQMFRVRWADSKTPAREWNNRDGETFSPQAGGGGEYLISGLQPGVTYEVQVAAEDDTGRGDWASTTVALNPFSLDANADGKITAADGIIIARYLLGVETEDGGLFAGQIPPGLTDAQKAVLLENLSAGKLGKYLDVVGDGNAEPDDKDGLAVARYLLGLPPADSGGGGGGGDADAVGTAIEALMAQ